MVRGRQWWRGNTWLPISEQTLPHPLPRGFAVLEVAEKMTGSGNYIESAKEMILYPLTLQLTAELVYVLHDSEWAAQRATVMLPNLSSATANILSYVPFSALRFVSGIQSEVHSLRDRSIDDGIYSTVDVRSKHGLPQTAPEVLARIKAQRRKTICV